MRHARRGFTLVELLVVIAIIALLISILLPALSKAKKQANTIKCLASLREIGNAFGMYSVENKGMWPVCSYDTYQRDAIYGGGSITWYWYNFLQKYMTKGQVGGAALSSADRTEGRKNIFWNCPEWEGIAALAYNGNVYPYSTGYGFNYSPNITVDYPANGANIPDKEKANIRSFAKGKFYKQVQYSHPSERALIADANFYVLQERDDIAAVTDADKVPPQHVASYLTLWTGAVGETSYDWYRHGTYPPVGTTSAGLRLFDGNDTAHTNAHGGQAYGGKVGCNILYCDGHASTVTSIPETYRALRMRFPG
jgi:prepilin-type N-terminal cleavage/methylation domain-containing protein/prepilin-type processing-associated H-X9-DG protein